MRLIERFKRAVRSGYRKTKTKGAAITAAGALAVGGLGGAGTVEAQSPEFQKALDNGASITQTAKTAVNSYLPGADDRAGPTLGQAAEDNNKDKVISTLAYHGQDLDYNDLGAAYIDAAKMGNLDIMKLLDDQGDFSSQYAAIALSTSSQSGNITPEIFEYVWEQHHDNFSANQIEEILEEMNERYWKNKHTVLTASQLIIEKNPRLIADQHLYNALGTLLDSGDTDSAAKLINARTYDLKGDDYNRLALKHFWNGQRDITKFLIDKAGHRLDNDDYSKLFQLFSYNKDPEAIKILLDEASWKLTNTAVNDGLKAMAKRGDNESITAVLNNRTAIRNLKVTTLEEAVEIAKEKGHEETVTVLKKGIETKNQPVRWYYYPGMF